MRLMMKMLNSKMRFLYHIIRREFLFLEPMKNFYIYKRLLLMGKQLSIENRKMLGNFKNQSNCGRVPENVTGLVQVLKAGDEEIVFAQVNLLAKDPIEQFKEWYKTAKDTPEVDNADIMCIATAASNGLPSARSILFRGVDEDEGFKFYTDYSSRKGRELTENPHVALVFQWSYTDADGRKGNRQVRIEGTVAKLSREASLEYFCTQPLGAKVRVHVCRQSHPVDNWNELFQNAKTLVEDYKKKQDLPMPDNWGGYSVIPESIEFYQGTKDSINDRIYFRKKRETDAIDGNILHQGVGDWVYQKLMS